MRRLLLCLAVAVSAATAHSTAQHQLQPVAALKGEPALELALRKLDTVGSFMMTTAHPDDENNAMLAYFAHGKGFRTSLVTATHGEGGQNEIGPELFVPLAVLRTEELLAAHRFDGAEQYFTRAIDFGYSFSIEETLEKWGHQEILGDFVRMIRTIRPDVIVGFVFDGDGGGQHHQASTRLTLEAFRAAADPAKFPEQIKEGLRPWQAAKFYYTSGFGPPTSRPAAASSREALEAPTPLNFAGGDVFDSVLGRTYNEIAGEARSMHKCQGMSQLLPLPVNTGGGPMGPGGVRAYRLRDTVLEGGVGRAEKEIFDGVDTSLRSLTRFAPASAKASAGLSRDELGARLDGIAATVADARKALAASGTTAAIAPLNRGLKAIRDLRASLGLLDEQARFEIDHRLAQKERQFTEALVLAADIRLDAIARDGLVPAGGMVTFDLIAAIRSTAKVSVTAAINGLRPQEGSNSMTCGSGNPMTGPGRMNCAGSLQVPADAKLTAAHFRMPASTFAQGASADQPSRYIFDADVPFGLPFRPSPYTATFNLTIEGTPLAVTIPFQARSEGDIFSGEKRHEIHVVPAFAVTTTPEIIVVSTNPGTGNREPGSGKDVRVTVTNHARGPADGNVTLDLPQGWRATPAAQPVRFTREDESITVRFTLQPPSTSVLAAAAMKPGGNQFSVKANVTSAGQVYAQGFQVVEYPHTTRRHVLLDPQVNVKALDVRVRPNLNVGYVMGVGDEVPAALEQLGVKPTFISADELAWGDLSRYDVIVTGVRAYERRADLRAYNQRLLDYANAGGTVIVQYNKLEFNDAQFGPYPARVGRDRVTDENAELRVLAPNHPLFTTPNAIGRADWTGWVQERGLYFLDETGRDPRYADLVEFSDPFPFNPGVKRGALVEAKVGKGRWLYVGLGLWRQLPAGTDGAYRLMANLLSLN
ncbi:MAG TPA: PIG-L family deacetylase [Vicinamibacterales bacterium]|nr:PIG-L family deacetylase [Vicinamibacterales bacterium]